MPGVGEVRFHDLFWKTLEPHRHQPHYRGLRDKLAWFIQRKQISTDPVSGRDGNFGPNRLLAGVWHFAITRNPDIVVFYTLDGGALNLAMVGSHHDYPFNGKNMSVSGRTASRVRNAVASGPAPTPAWDGLRWSDPADLLETPELPELSAWALDTLTIELLEEMETGARYRRRHGIAVEDASEEEFDRYFADLTRARDSILGLRASLPGTIRRIDRRSNDRECARALPAS